jgi:DNA adenine methylase
MQGKEWEFRVAHWEETLTQAGAQDFVYMDPPYIGRHADYFNSWGLDEAEKLAEAARKLPCGYALSMWLENRHRKNDHIAQCWSQGEMRLCGHFYHVGSSETLRNEMDEALVIKPGFATPDIGRQRTRQEPKPDTQLSLAIEKRAVYRV